MITMVTVVMNIVPWNPMRAVATVNRHGIGLRRIRA